MHASRATHAAIGVFAAEKYAVVDMAVASRDGAVARQEALAIVRRTIGLYEPAHRELGRSDRADGPRALIWLNSERCLVGLGPEGQGHAAFVALVGAPEAPAFAAAQRAVARLGLLYEAERLDRLRAEAAGPADRSAIDEIMAGLDLACAVVDAERTVVYANRAGTLWLRGDRPLRMLGGRLAVAGAEPQRRFAGAVRAATAGEPRQAQALVLRDAEPGAVPLIVSCLPLPGSDGHALLLFGGAGRSGDLTEVMLGAFGLTRAERRLARHILLGRALEEAAEEAGIRISTARGYLKSIFAKTGMRRQGEFVAVIGGLVPPLVLPQDMKTAERRCRVGLAPAANEDRDPAVR